MPDASTRLAQQPGEPRALGECPGIPRIRPPNRAAADVVLPCRLVTPCDGGTQTADELLALFARGDRLNAASIVTFGGLVAA